MQRQELRDKGYEYVMAAPQLYLDVDVEADGIAGYGSMLSIGAQSPDGKSFYYEIKPYSDVYLPGHRDFCEEHGLQHERLLEEGNELSFVMEAFKNYVKELEQEHQKQVKLTAFNAAFDWAHVDLAFKLSGIFEEPLGIAPFDLKSLALPVGGSWDFSQTAKSKLPSIVVPDGEFTHHALEDAQYQQEIHFGLAGLLGSDRYQIMVNNND